MQDPDRTTAATSDGGVDELRSVPPRKVRRLTVALAALSQSFERLTGAKHPPLDLEAALRVVYAAAPHQLDDRHLTQLAVASVMLADEIQSEISTTGGGGASAHDAEGAKRVAALVEWITDHGASGLAQSLLPGLRALGAQLDAHGTRSARARGRRPKGDVRAYGALLSLYQLVSGRAPRRDKPTLAFLQRFMEAAGPAFDAAEGGARRPPSGKTAGQRWLPLTEANFRKRFGEFRAAMDLDRARGLIERAGEVGEE